MAAEILALLLCQSNFKVLVVREAILLGDEGEPPLPLLSWSWYRASEDVHARMLGSEARLRGLVNRLSGDRLHRE